MCHKHFHFTDVRAKGAEFEGWDFSYSVFTRAYFHETTFANCKFVGAQFIDCNFRNAKLRRTDFSYARFNGTTDRKSRVKGKSVSVRVDLGGRRIIKTKKYAKSMVNNDNR